VLRLGLVAGVVAALGALVWAVMTTDMGTGPGNSDQLRKRAQLRGGDAVVRDEMDFRLGGMA